MTAADTIAHLTQDLSDDARSMLPEASAVEDAHSWLHTQLGAIARSLRLSRPGVPLHAAACVIGDRAILVPGNTGSGKSTLVTTICRRRESRFISDDTVWISEGAAEGLGAPISVRHGSPWFTEVSGTASHIGQGQVRLLARPADLGIAVQNGPAIVSHVLFPRFRPDQPPTETELTPAASFCRLVSAAFHLSSDAGYDELALVASAAVSICIDYPDTDSSLMLVDRALAIEAVTNYGSESVKAPEMVDEGFGPDTAAMRFGDEAAIWNRATSQIVHLAAWPRGTALRGTDAWQQLRAMGFVGESNEWS